MLSLLHVLLFRTQMMLSTLLLYLLLLLVVELRLSLQTPLMLWKQQNCVLLLSVVLWSSTSTVARLPLLLLML